MDLSEFTEVLDDDGFEEYPVDIRTFVEHEDFLNLGETPLSDIQYTIVSAMSQIYKLETLILLYGEDEGNRVWDLTVNEIIAVLGKGSGKDHCSTIAVAYIVYKLLCLKDPAKYYGRPSGDTIDIVNIAINAVQAKNTFYKNFVTKIKGCAWFQGKYDDKTNYVEFDKNITCYSGHSEAEGWEGYNLIAAILDEISGFSMENNTGHQQAKTADAIYKMYAASVESRFDEVGKLVLLSFPRFKGDFISTRYDAAVAQKETEICEYTFKVDENLPDGIEENEYTVEWNEDKIVSYREPGVFAIKAPTWKVNPTKTIRSFKRAFFTDPIDALSRFACMPPDAIDAFFKDQDKVRAAFSHGVSPFHGDWTFKQEFEPNRSKLYYVHADLAYKHDRAAVAIAHVENWKHIKVDDLFTEINAEVVIDAVRWWTPTSDQEIDLGDVKDYILQLKKKGFNIKLVTFDQWHSFEVKNDLEKGGIETDKLSVAKPHYEDFQFAIYENRVKCYPIDILLDELFKLRIIKGNKVDHPRKGGKDLADAVTGAFYNAMTLTPRNTDDVIIEAYVDEMPRPLKQINSDIIKVPSAGERTPIPDDISAFIKKMQLI